MSKQVSIIIPFYNAGNYINKCIKSIVAQQFSNIEIILIDDGSDDNSLAICKHYITKYNQIQLIHLNHSGEANAINIGVAASHGDYVMFVSALDWLNGQDVINTLYQNIIKSSSDIAIPSYCEFKNDNLVDHNLKDFEKSYTPQQWFKFEYQANNDMNKCFTCLYGKLFTRSLLDYADFTNDSSSTSDANTWKLYLLADKISFVSAKMYVSNNTAAKSSTYHFQPEKLHSLKPVEERIAILTKINFDITAELKEYINRLNYQRNQALKKDDYYVHLNSISKIDTISKYK